MGNKSSHQNNPLKEEIPNIIYIPNKNVQQEKTETSQNNSLND